jgi:hypothetical protein
MDESSLFAAAGIAENPEAWEEAIFMISLVVFSVPLILYAIFAIGVWCWFFWRKVTVFSLFVAVALASLAALYVRLSLLWMPY